MLKTILLAIMLVLLVAQPVVADPSPPTELDSEVDGSSVIFTWESDAGVGAVYYVYRNGVQLDYTTSTMYTDTIVGDVFQAVYNVTVLLGGVESAPSNSVYVLAFSDGCPWFTINTFSYWPYVAVGAHPECLPNTDCPPICGRP